MKEINEPIDISGMVKEVQGMTTEEERWFTWSNPMAVVPAEKFMTMSLQLHDYYNLLRMTAKESLELWEETYEETSRELKSLERIIALKKTIDERDEKNGQ